MNTGIQARFLSLDEKIDTLAISTSKAFDIQDEKIEEVLHILKAKDDALSNRIDYVQEQVTQIKIKIAA